MMETDTSDGGVWRDIEGAASDPDRHHFTLFLECGHRLKLHYLTPLGESFAQKLWTRALCYQCTQ